MLRNVLRDLRFTLRSLARQPLFAVTVTGSLALGIGACAIIFSVVYALLLKPLPYGRPEELVHVGAVNPSLGGENSFDGVAPAALTELRGRADTGFSEVGGFVYDYANLTGVPAPTQVTVSLTTEGYLGVFGVAPAQGRLFTPEDHRPGATLTAVLTDRLWRTQFHADPGLLGRTILVAGKPRVVVGIMPASFKEPNNVAELWLPIPADDPMMVSPTNCSLSVVGRLADGRPATRDKVRAVLATVSANLAAARPVDFRGWQLATTELPGYLAGGAQRRGLWLVLGAVGCVLLVTCANVANLQLGRASVRRREYGLRQALGASRGRIIQQTLVESLFLALLGGGLALLLAAWGVEGVRALLPAGYSPRQEEIALSGPVVAFAWVVAGLTGVICGALPAWFASRQNPAGALAGGGRSTAGGPGGGRTRGLLVVAEIALALVLLMGAGLMGQSFAALLRTPPGLRTERVLTLGLSLSENSYPDPARRAEFYRRVLAAVRTVPGVENAALTSTDFFNWTISGAFLKPGQAPDDPAAAKQVADYDAVNPDCFAALDIPLRRGRAFDRRDVVGAPPVAIVNEQFARLFFPGTEALGQRIILTGGRPSPAPTVEIVGVTADVRRRGVGEAPSAQVYVPCLQRPTTFATLLVRAGGALPAENLTCPVQAAVWSVDPEQPVAHVSTLARARRENLGPTRLYLALFAGFAGLTVGLAALGVYGTVSYGVSQRTRELGIRLALGGQPADVLRLVLGQTARLTGWGLALGAAAALASARLLTTLLYRVAANDAPTLVGVALGLGAVALLAGYLPARRATRIDPLAALREE